MFSKIPSSVEIKIMYPQIFKIAEEASETASTKESIKDVEAFRCFKSTQFMSFKTNKNIINDAVICDKNRIKPSFSEFKIPLPIVRIIKEGPALIQQKSNFFAFSLLKASFWYSHFWIVSAL